MVDSPGVAIEKAAPEAPTCKALCVSQAVRLFPRLSRGVIELHPLLSLCRFRLDSGIFGSSSLWMSRVQSGLKQSSLPYDAGLAGIANMLSGN